MNAAIDSSLASAPIVDPETGRVAPNLREVGAVRAHLLAGRSIFTLQSARTGKRYTFRVAASELDMAEAQREKRAPKGPFFVSVLTGPDNGSDYSFLGMLYGSVYVHGVKSKLVKGCPAEEAFSFLMACLKRNTYLPTNLLYFPAGTCARCGDMLSVPASLAVGMGPDCAKKMRQGQLF